MSLSDSKVLLDLTATLYECTEADPMWNPFLSELAGATGAAVVATSYSTKSCIGVDPAETVRYERDFLFLNPWLAAGRRYHEGQILRTEEVLPFQAYRRTAFCQEWGKRNQVVHGIGVCFQERGPFPLVLTINRGEGRGPFEDWELAPLQPLVPHLKRAAFLRERLAEVEAQSWMLDNLAFPMLMIAQDRKLRWMNAAASRFLEEDGRLQLRQGFVFATFAGDDSILEKALRGGRFFSNSPAVEGFGEWAPLSNLEDSGRNTWMCIAPAPSTLQRKAGGIASAAHTGMFVAIILNHEVRSQAMEQRLKLLYGLTAAEANVAIGMVDAQSVNDLAERLKISRNTVKTQLASVFAKLGIRRQTELIRILSELASLAPGK